MNGATQATGGQRPDDFSLDLVIIETSQSFTANATWSIAGAMLRDTNTDWPIVGNLAGTFQYWWDQDTNGYTRAVFHYWVESESVANDLIAARQAELANGAAPIEHTDQTIGALAAPETTAISANEDPDDNDASCDDQQVSDASGAARSHAISTALVWRLGAELVRRHPRRLWIHPEGGGNYDRVTIVDLTTRPTTWVMTMNAIGSNSQFKNGAQKKWSEAFADGADPAQWIREAERLCELPTAPKPLPPSTPSSLAARFIAIFLTAQIGSRDQWFPCAVDDFADGATWYAKAAFNWRQQRPLATVGLIFLAKKGCRTPQLAVTSDGTLVRHDSSMYRLDVLHMSGHSMTQLLIDTVPDLMP